MKENECAKAMAAVPQPQVSEKINRHRDTLERMQGLINNMEGKLLGILRNQPPVPEQVSEKEKDELVPVANEIQILTNIAEDIESQMCSIIGRIEI